MTPETDALIARALARDPNDKLARMLRWAIDGMTKREVTIEEALAEIEKIAREGNGNG